MTNETEIAPALTPEEWQSLREGNGFPYGSRTSLVDEAYGHVIDAEDRHALAAALLYGAPFGFTHAHAGAISGVIRGMREVFSVKGEKFDALVGLLEEACDRITALLPPE